MTKGGGGGGVWFSALDKGGWLIVYYHCSERDMDDQCFIILPLLLSLSLSLFILSPLCFTQLLPSLDLSFASQFFSPFLFLLS